LHRPRPHSTAFRVMTYVHNNIVSQKPIYQNTSHEYRLSPNSTADNEPCFLREAELEGEMREHSVLAFRMELNFRGGVRQCI